MVQSASQKDTSDRQGAVGRGGHSTASPLFHTVPEARSPLLMSVLAELNLALGVNLPLVSWCSLLYDMNEHMVSLLPKHEF